MKKSELIKIIKDSILPSIRSIIREELDYVIKKSDQIDETTKAKNKEQFDDILNKRKTLLDENFNPNKKLSQEYANAPNIIKNIVNKDYSKMFAKKK